MGETLLAGHYPWESFGEAGLSEIDSAESSPGERLQGHVKYSH